MKHIFRATGLTLITLLFILSGCNKSGNKIDRTLDDFCSSISEAEITHHSNLELNKFSIDTTNIGVLEGYSVLSYSAFGHNVSVKFYMTVSGYYAVYNDSNYNEKYKGACFIKIDEEDWHAMKDIIYEYDFWDEPICRSREGTDGFGYVVQGITRSKMIGRGLSSKSIIRFNIHYDKVSSLANYILGYGHDLYLSSLPDDSIPFPSEE